MYPVRKVHLIKRIVYMEELERISGKTFYNLVFLFVGLVSGLSQSLQNDLPQCQNQQVYRLQSVDML